MSPPPKRWRPSASRWSTASMTRPRSPSRNRCANSCRRSACRWRAARSCRPAQFNQILERVRRRRQRGAGQRGGAALAEPGRILAGEYRPFRAQPAPLRAFHLADPALCRPDRPSRADLRARLGPDGITRPEEERLEEISGADLRDRAPRHGGRTRDGRPAGRRLSGRTASTKPSTRASRASPRRDYLSNCRHFGADGFIPISIARRRLLSSSTKPRAPCSASASGKGYQLADRVEVRLVEVAPMAGAMRFEMLSEPKPLPGSKRSFHKSKEQRQTAARFAAAWPRSRR